MSDPQSIPEKVTVSQYELSNLDNFVSCTNLNRMALRRSIIAILKSFYSNKKNFDSFLLGTYPEFNYTYSDIVTDFDGKSLDILRIIPDYQYADSMESAEAKFSTLSCPTIIVGVEDSNFEKKVTNCRYAELEDGSGVFYGCSTNCNISVSSYAYSYADCEVMAYLNTAFLSGPRYQFITLSKMDEFLPVAQTKPKAINTNNTKKIYMATSIFSATWQTVWVTREESSRIRNIMIQTNPSI